MTAKQFVMRLAWINIPFLILVCGLNYWIDGRSAHHLPGEPSFFPRTTAHSALSKLHYLSLERPDIIYFGSSRVEVGLPANSDLVGGRQVYNAGLSGATMGQWVPFIKHTLYLTDPGLVVIGVDFPSFTAKVGSSDLDLSLLSTNYIVYLIKRIPYDLGQALSISSIRNSIQSITALFSGVPYDNPPQMTSALGQLTEMKMQAITEARGKVDRAFQEKIKAAFKKPSKDVADEKAWRLFDSLLTEICHKDIVARIFIHPTHALTTDAIRQNGAWSGLEQWKTNLANLATRYQRQQCDVKIFDFSGYNSITTETIVGLSPTTSLHYYWEASHYKSNVGELILKRLLMPSAQGVPSDFGRELRQNTVADVLSTIRQEQSSYLALHSEDIKLAQQWLSVKK